MLRAKIEVSTNSDITRRTKRVPTIEIPPISSGMPAATTPRKTSSRRSARIGKAISSALVRSVLVWSFTSLKLARVAAHRDLQRPRPGGHRFDLFGDDPAAVFEVAAGEVDEEDERAPVLGDQLGAGPAVVQRVDDAADAIDPGDAAAEPVHGAPHRVGPRGRAAPRPGRGRRARVPGWGRSRGHRRAALWPSRDSEAGSVKPAALRWLLDVFAEGDRDEGEDPDGPEDQLRVLPGEVGDPGEHRRGDRTRFQSECFEKQIEVATIAPWVAANTASRAASPALSTRSASAGRCSSSAS